ncbi:hypothetical protein EPO33_05375 [Patescibacteria group bacterium]|nr:MAG: hypothetical protein EPO33_05375 [Patescibacteria group bacterium]
MSFFARLVGADSGIDEHPSWLLQCLHYARIRKNPDGSLLLIVEADDKIGMHGTFARLQPRLVTAAGVEIPLTVVEYLRDCGFPVRCTARPADAVTFDADGKVSVQKLRLSFNGVTKDLEVTNAKEGS